MVIAIGNRRALIRSTRRAMVAKDRSALMPSIKTI